MDFTDLIGLPWRPKGRTRAGVDCWGLVWLCYRERFGIELPAGTDRYDDPSDRKENERIIAEGIVDWRMVPANEARPGDVVLMKRGGDRCHTCLLVRRGWVLHIREAINSVQLPIYRVEREGYKVAGYYRHRDRR